MKVLLLSPPHPDDPPREVVVPPLGAAYLAAALEEAGHDVSILDALALRLDWSELGREIAKRSPAMLGLGGMSPVIADSYRAAEIARPFVRWIVLGGPHATIRGARVWEECAAIDYLVLGEGERALPRLVAELEAGERLNPIPFPQEPIENLDSLPFPARHLLPHDPSPYHCLPWGRGPVTTIMSSRGCPFRCIFCDKSVHGSRWRARKAEDVVEEVAKILAGEGEGRRAPFLVFYDDLFTHDRERVREICEGIVRRKLAARWKCEARPDQVDAPMLKEMRRAGCEIVAFGVESGNSESLRFLRKGFTTVKIEDAFRLARQAGLRTLAYVIIGVPGETPREARASVRFSLGLDPDAAQFSTLALFEGSPLFTLAGPQGWGRVTSSHNPFDRDAGAGGRLAVVPPGWTEDDLRSVLRYAYLRLAVRRRSVEIVARAAAGAGGPRAVLRLALRFAGWLTGGKAK